MKCQIKKWIIKNSHKTKQFQQTSFKAFYGELQNILQREQCFLCGSRLFTTQKLHSTYILPNGAMKAITYVNKDFGIKGKDIDWQIRNIKEFFTKKTWVVSIELREFVYWNLWSSTNHLRCKGSKVGIKLLQIIWEVW